MPRNELSQAPQHLAVPGLRSAQMPATPASSFYFFIPWIALLSVAIGSTPQALYHRLDYCGALLVVL